MLLCIKILTHFFSAGGFSRSIENIFHCSFLIRDNSAKLFFKDGIPLISLPSPENPTSDVAREDLPSQQLMFSLNMGEWKEFVKLYNLQVAMIEVPKSISGTQLFAPMLFAHILSNQPFFYHLAGGSVVAAVPQAKKIRN